jgi:hypothetical protein
MNRHLLATYTKYGIDTHKAYLEDDDIKLIFTSMSKGLLNWDNPKLYEEMMQVRRDYPSGRYLYSFMRDVIQCSSPPTSPTFWTSRGYNEEQAQTRAREIQVSRKSVLTTSYWTDQGLSEKDAKNQVSREQSQRSIKSYSVRDKDYRLRKTPRSVRYWLSRGYTLDAAQENVRRIGENHKRMMTGRPSWVPTHKRNTHIAFYKALGLSDTEAKIALRKRQTTRFTDEQTRVEWHEYYCECWWHTRQNLSKVGDIERRSKEFHLDHRYSIYDGFYTRVPPEIIGSAVNLRIVPASVNQRKQRNSDISKEELYNAYGRL